MTVQAPGLRRRAWLPKIPRGGAGPTKRVRGRGLTVRGSSGCHSRAAAPKAARHPRVAAFANARPWSLNSARYAATLCSISGRNAPAAPSEGRRRSVAPSWSMSGCRAPRSAGGRVRCCVGARLRCRGPWRTAATGAPRASAIRLGNDPGDRGARRGEGVTAGNPRSPSPSTPTQPEATFGGQRSPRLKVTASNGRMHTEASFCAVAISTHSASRSSKASRMRSAGSTNHR